jgi:probable HAF family extracellular repeat protein
LIQERTSSANGEPIENANNPHVFANLVDRTKKGPRYQIIRHVPGGMDEDWTQAPADFCVDLRQLRDTLTGIKRIRCMFSLYNRSGMIWFALSVFAATGLTRPSVTLLQPLSGYIESYALGVNSGGQVVGYSSSPSGVTRATLWNHERVIDLGTLPGYTSSRATGINNRGTIVGYASSASGSEQAVVWSGGVPAPLPPLSAGQRSAAFGVNDADEVVGWSSTSNTELFPHHAVLWRRGGIAIDLGTILNADSSQARAINNRGQITGFVSHGPFPFRAFFWDGDQMYDLGVLPDANPRPRVDSSGGFAINNRGDIAGFSISSDPVVHAAVWSKRESVVDLGHHSPARQSFATGINNRGQIVGRIDSPSIALLWNKGSLTDLTIYAPAGWSLSAANGINDSGDIVGSAVGPSNELNAFFLRH